VAGNPADPSGTQARPEASARPRRMRGVFVLRAAGVSIESLPLNQFPPSIFLRSTWARWDRDGVLPRLFAAGAKAEKRMEKQYDDEILRLTWERAVVTGKATETMPRWTHVRQP
jgi:hypothetical protein